ncbi:hypothetical protein [Synechococcus sp. CBW1004]|uniref:hypothetical protein n=1 Tax=Synechococcus sp. CBW1004 TaxID=1353136 RepID=UPI001E30CB81|nr:hypothetical protein [Synechococcus sp. CBW1004]
MIRGRFTLLNPSRPELDAVEVSALADSGAVHLCIPEHLAILLQLSELERRDGARQRDAAGSDPDGGHGPGAAAADTER